MMLRNTATILFFCFTSITLFAQNQKFNGLSVNTGNLHPDGPNFGVALQNELMVMRELDIVVKYDMVYELKNTTQSFCTVNASLPVNIYFNEFAYGKRTPMLDQLAQMATFSDLFRVQDASLDLREQIRMNFQQRLFVRKYVSTETLKQLGIYVDVFRNNIRVNVKKILCEIKFIDEDRLNQTKDTEVLGIEIKFMLDLNFQPDELTNLMVFVTMPSIMCGTDQQEIYSPYQLGFEKNWAGVIQNFYLQHDVFTATPVVPTKLSAFDQKFSGERDQVLVFKNLTPADKDWIAFYHLNGKNTCNPQMQFSEQVIVPSPVKNITSSSYVKSGLDLTDRNFMTTAYVAISDSITRYQTGNPTGIDMFSKSFAPLTYKNSDIYSQISVGCKSGEPAISLKESGNPVFAFDITDFIDLDSSYTGVENLGKQTCWCEGNANSGTGEWIQFTITQPVNEFMIYNGNMVDRKTFDESTKVGRFVISSQDGFILDKLNQKSEVKFSIIDLAIQNIYQLPLEPGTYRITFDLVDPGKIPVTCLSTIMFDFVYKDEWFNQANNMINSFLAKM